VAKEYNIARTGQCRQCENRLAENEQFVAVVVENGEDFERQDWCQGCWDAPDRPAVEGLFGQWLTKMPTKKGKKKTFVDDAMLINFFQRLAGADEPARVNFRFVLALVLMRKKLLTYQRSDTDADGVEKWAMLLKGADEPDEVINPKLDEDKIAEVSEQLTDIMEGGVG
jgi:hypothetical protein